jgi:WD40 repeat protein
MIGHRSPISGVATYGDRYVASAGYDNHVILWDMQTGYALSRGSHDHLVNYCAFNGDGTALVTASSDYTARVWTVPGLALTAVLNEHEDDVEMAVFHPSRDLIATASRDHCVRVFSGDGALLQRFKGHAADVISVEWITGSTELISSGDDGTIRRWALDGGCQVEVYDLAGIETDTVVVSPNGTIYAGTDGGEIVTMLNGRRTSTTAHSAGIKRLAYSANKQMLVSLSYDRSIKIWSCRSDELSLIRQAVMPPDVWARSCAFGPDDMLVFGSFGARFRQYRYTRDAWDTPAPVTLGINAICAVEGVRYTIGDAGWLWRNGIKQRELGSLCNFLLPWGVSLLTGGQNGILFDAITGESIFEHRSPLNCGTTYVVGSEERVVIGTYTGEGLVFRRRGIGAKPELVTTLRLHENAVKGVAFVDGRLFSVCADTSCAWTDAASHSVQYRLPRAHRRIANACAALPNGDFVSVSRDRMLRFWTGYEARAIDTPHRNSIKCVAVDDSGRFVASGSYGGHIAVFDRCASEWQFFIRPSFAGISSLFFDAYHRCFIASAYDGTVHEIKLSAAR